MKSLSLPLLIVCAALFGPQSVALAKATPVAAPARDACNWNRPGVNPFTGDVVAAVDRYTDIPTEVRERLKARMAKREYDDIVSIRRDSITGGKGYEYGNAIRDMHFGPGKLCKTVTRSKWSSKMHERGLVYCDSGQCILVPTVCRNVSRIARRGVANERADGGPLGDGPAPDALAADPKVGALGAAPGGEASTGVPPIDYFGPTGAGTSSTALSADGGANDGAPGVGGTSGIGGPVGFPGMIVGGGPGGVVAVAPPAGGGDGGGGGGILPIVTTPIPEPQTWALMLAGLAALAGWRRRAARR